jgi:arylsulfatase
MIRMHNWKSDRDFELCSDEFDKSIMQYPSITRFPGGASTDLRPNLQDPKNPVPSLDPAKPPRVEGGGG